MASDPMITAIFEDTLVSDLETILFFFETQICDMLQVRSDSTLDCYPVFFNNVATAQGTGVIYIPVSYEAQKEMYRKLSADAFREIWMIGRGVEQASGNTIERLSLSFEGGYMEFLDSLRKEVTVLDAYYRSFESEKRMTPVMIEGVMYNYHLYDMSDIRMRLFVALHYLTLNDIYERRDPETQEEAGG